MQCSICKISRRIDRGSEKKTGKVTSHSTEREETLSFRAIDSARRAHWEGQSNWSFMTINRFTCFKHHTVPKVNSQPWETQIRTTRKKKNRGKQNELLALHSKDTVFCQLGDLTGLAPSSDTFPTLLFPPFTALPR